MHTFELYTRNISFVSCEFSLPDGTAFSTVDNYYQLDIRYFRTTQVGENPKNEVDHPSVENFVYLKPEQYRLFLYCTSSLFCHPKPGVSWCLCSQRCGNNLFQITKTDRELRERKVDLETSFIPSIQS